MSFPVARANFRHIVAGRAGLASLVVLGALLAGCAGPVTQRTAVDPGAQAREERAQTVLALRSEWEATLRLWRVGYPVLKAAAFDCAEQLRPSLGVFAARTQDVPEKQRALVAEAAGLDSQPRIREVYPRSAAAAAGVQVGDIIQSSSAGIGTPNESAADARQRMPADRPVKLTLLRQDQPLSVEFVPDQICDYRLTLASNDSAVNAYADGNKVIITRGMMRFASDDRELALVIGHEIGHNTMGHITKKNVNAGLGLVVDVLIAATTGVNTGGAFSQIGAGAYSQDFEREADYVGMYYMKLAGYPTEGAAQFWRRMATEFPASIKASHAATHPATAERFVALDQTDAEIQKKADTGSALVPNKAK